MASAGSQAHQSHDLIKLFKVAKIVYKQTVEPVLDQDLFDLHLFEMIQGQFELMLPHKSSYHVVPAGRAER